MKIKRIISFLLAFSTLLSFVPTAVFADQLRKEIAERAENPFTDVRKSDWFYDAVQYVRINEIFTGSSNTAFKPRDTMTRGMFVTMLGRLAGVDSEKYKGLNVYTDVSRNAYYAPYVAWAAKHGITVGTGDGTFSPDDVITRQEMATFLARYFEKFNVKYDTVADITTLPADIGSVAEWAQDSVLKLWRHGLINGDGVYFNPTANATRADNAALAARADQVVIVWYQEPGLPSDRVRIDPTTGMPFDENEDTKVDDTKEDAETVVPDDQPSDTLICYTVTYTDGVSGETVFADQTHTVVGQSSTPAFVGTPVREGYLFLGWSPTVMAKVTANTTYRALWQAIDVTPEIPTVPVVPTPATYTVTYTDGVTGKVIFADQVHTVQPGAATPGFTGTPAREGYTFTGWAPAVADTVSANVTYTAQWSANAVTPGPVTYTVTYTDGVVDAVVFADQITSVVEGGLTPAFIGSPTQEGYTFIGWSPAVADIVTESITYTAQWEAGNYAVSFYDGDVLIDTLYAENGKPLGSVPSIVKSSKANAILLGYYTDPAFTAPFYAENPVTGNMKVYAKYEDMGDAETITFTSFAQMDQDANIRFEISGSGNPTQAVTLEVMDGSDPVTLDFTPTDSGYIVYAPAGFNEGCSYQLHLADGWTFTGKPNTIRTASFSIYMEEVENLQMNDDIVYIMDTDDIRYTVNGETYDVLTANLVTEAGGRFAYTNANTLSVNDILCIYSEKHPEQRDNGSDTLLPVAYVKVININGELVTFVQLSAEDQQSLYEIPDNFPIRVDVLPTETTGTVNISGLDEEMYSTMMGEGYDLAKAKDSIAIGDFITLYVDSENITSEESLYYGEITGYNAETGEIAFKQTTRQAILDSMDLYANVNLSGSDYITDEEKAEMEDVLLAQVQDSGFAEDAAFMLADIISKTDAFRNTEGIQSLIITDADGNPLSSSEIELLNLGGNFELTDDIKLTVELITKGERLHYNGGVQIAIGIEAEFEVELEDDEKISIDLSATFVQEVFLDPKVKGGIVYKEILWIPIPIGVSVGATIDVKSFTSFSFDAVVLTVAPEDESLWDQFTDVVKNPEKLAELDFLPDELSKGLKTAGDVLDKIEELQDEVSKMVDTAEGTVDQINAYLEDIEMLWGVIEENGLTTREDWAEMCSALDKTNITSDLLDMMNLTNEVGLETEYYDSMQALMDRYCEMLEQESDWVTLVNQEMFMAEACVLGIAIGMEVNFVVRADLSLAIGSNLEYEVGKRYEFWFKIGLFKPTAGSSTMDLLDEHFAFQFYVMGRLGLKAGIRAKFYVGIGSGKLAQVGIAVELGPYIKIYGFFVYEYTKYRAANTVEWISNERMGGALFMEFGLYLMIGLEAEALSLFEYSYDFVDEEFPLLTAGTKRFYYQPDYAPEEGEIVLVKDVDNNSVNGITMVLPEELIGLKFTDLVTGLMGVESLDYDKYHYSVSNPNFSIDSDTGEISVTVPDGVRYMECDLTVTYKYSKMAFSTFDMSVTIPLVWTNMATDELTQFYTAAVRVGNDGDGYETVWTKRILKNKPFDLPAAEDPNNEIDGDILELMSWDDYKHIMGTGYGNQQLTNLTIIDNKVYDFDVDYKTYAVTVEGIQKADGTTESRTYYANYGEGFDFSDLAGTGTVDYVNGIFTTFASLTTDATISVKVGKDADGQPLYEEQPIDFTKPISAKIADKLNEGIVLTATYVDNSITATFTFTGIDAEDISVKLRRGDTPSLKTVENLVSDYGMDIVDIFPAVGKITASTTYQMICGELTGPEATIQFEENGGTEVSDITKVVGSLIGDMPTPVYTGFAFEGWYTDTALTQRFDLTKMPEGGAKLYAKWIVSEFELSFHVNGGNALEAGMSSKTVNYGQPCGELPVPERTGYGFMGWYTAAEGGEPVTAETVYSTVGNSTVYAQWRQLKEISGSIFDFGEAETFTYKRNTIRTAEYTFTPEEEASYVLEDFTITYIAEGYEDEGYVTDPYEAGTWGVKITRPADDTYAKFEGFYPGVLVIEKVNRTAQHLSICSGRDMEDHPTKTANGYTYLVLNVVPYKFEWENISYDNLYYIDNSLLPLSIDADDSTRVVLSAYPKGTSINEPDKLVSASAPTKLLDDIIIYDLEPGVSYELYITFLADRNYNELTDWVYQPLLYYTDSGTTDRDQYGYWKDHTDTSWYNDTDTEFTISTAEQLAGLAELVDGGNNFAGKTVKLDADIDLGAFQWEPIGNYKGTNNLYMTIKGEPFSGVFDGQNHTISGMYVKQDTAQGVGLFGYLAAAVDIKMQGVGFKISGEVSGVKNLVLDDSYVYGSSHVGGIAGYVSAHYGATLEMAYGSLIKYKDFVTYIQNCTNNAVVEGKYYNVGGIAGRLAQDAAAIMNCANYGAVRGDVSYIGGIAGYMDGGQVYNNVNFGNIHGSDNVGGIVGYSDNGNGEVYNNCNYGNVVGQSNEYIGAVVGRNREDNGTVHYNYYLKNCAKGKDGKYRNALGTSDASVAFDKKAEKGYYASYFVTPADKMTQYVGEYATLDLITALNTWVTDNTENFAVVRWEAVGLNGYPVPTGTVIPAIRK